MKHKINIQFAKNHISNIGMTLHIHKCIRTAMDFQQVPFPYEINVLVTDNAGIRVINRETRQIDHETDVLSFPMFEFVPGELPEQWDDLVNPETGLVTLGDMVLSVEKAMEQGYEFGHGIKREIGYLVVHSALHLLGYDHLDEGPMKRQMRRQEESIMAQLLLRR
jgi:probable rRNA maturation factor